MGTRILIMADNKIGLQAIKYLVGNNYNVCGLVVHPKDMQNLTNEIISESGLQDNIHTYETNESLYEFVKTVEPELILLMSWGKIIKKEIVEYPKLGCVNIHLSLLPFNRGKNPNIWAIVNGTPAGITLHYIDTGVDTGNIISQVEVKIENDDTGKTLYNKLINSFLPLFKNTLPLITNEKFLWEKRQTTTGVTNLSIDLSTISEIYLDKEYKARDLINMIRARTFNHYPSCYFIDNGEKVYVRIDLEKV